MVARNKMVLTGSLGTSGEEAWSCGIHYVPSEGGSITSQERLDTWAQSALEAWGAAITGSIQMKAGLSAYGALQNVTIYGYGATGGAVASGTASTTTAGAGTAIHPPQCTACVSLQTTRLGASGRGRIYWPGLGLTLTANLRWAGMTQFATEFAAAMTAAGEEEVGLPFNQPAVYSPTTDTITVVSSIRVGNVIDTQRRRRDALVETYAVEAL